MANLRMCHNCGTLAYKLVRDKCPACYQWWRTHDHQDRPPEIYENMRQSRIRTCRTCGMVRWIKSDDECQTCYIYRRERGKQRPQEVIRKWKAKMSESFSKYLIDLLKSGKLDHPESGYLISDNILDKIINGEISQEELDALFAKKEGEDAES